MAAESGSQLTALCAIASFLWISYNLEHHQLIEYPRYSSLFILLISGIVSYAVSFFSIWLPGANGRFDDEREPLKTGPINLPKKPRRYYILLLVACVVQRLESFHRTTLDLQCATPGIEAFLPVVILVYELLPGRRSRTEPRVGPDHDYMMDSNFDYLADIARESKIFLVVATLFFSWGTYLATTGGIRSTFFCSSLLDDPSVLLATQWAGVILDGIIAVLLWRILAWARTTKSRLRTISSILLSSALGTALMYFALGKFYNYQTVTYSFQGLDSLYVFDLFIDAIVFSVFFISAGLLICESTPLTLAGVVTCAVGLLAGAKRLPYLGTWENVARGSTLSCILLLCIGLSIFVYANNLRSVAFVRRAFLVTLLGVLLTVAVFLTVINGYGKVMNHPLRKIIYDTRVEADRWLVHASVSKTVRVAALEYQERNFGRDPPPQYDVWYNFAVSRNSPILDHFPQIGKDILPFWGIPPSKIREDISRAVNEPDIVTVRIQDKKASHNLPAGSPHAAVMDDFVAMMKPFLQHIPDLVLPINLNDRPRLLTPWNDLRRLNDAGKRKGLKKLLSRRLNPEEPPSIASTSSGKRAETQEAASPDPEFTSVKAFREMTALTCPHNALARSGVHWDVRDICNSCARPHSRGQYLTDWELSRDLCHQPDLLRLHSFYMTPPAVRPIQELLPIFSRSKTDSYSDILIPLPRPDEKTAGETGGSEMKWKKLYWRGKVTRPVAAFTHEIWRGGQQERLVHLANNGSDQTAILLTTGEENEFLQETAFRHEMASTAELNAFLPLDIGFSEYAACTTPSLDCDLLQAEFGSKPEDFELGNKYIMLVDSDSGPPRDIEHIIRSGSVPLIASIFREWYTDRLVPWLHFVPIDLRFHALHSTLAYFTGLHGIINGRDPSMGDSNSDAEWIAEQGQRWSERSLRRDDMQVYLFRLLLEWARVTDDRRDELGFVYKKEE